jgi:NAD+ kinase
VKVYVLGNAQRQGVAEEVERWLPTLKSRFDVVACDICQETDLDKAPEADVAFVFGGDGAILRAARQMRYRQVPVLGVNLGRLGFLADLAPADLATGIEHILRAEYRVTSHLMYETVCEPLQGSSCTCLGLNEIAIHSLPPFHMLELDLAIDGDVVARFSGDGLIVSTPIGSTAHNLSAGGPILTPELDAFVVTPISPHALTHRPIVESADREYRICPAPRSPAAMVILDGQENLTLSAGDSLTIRRAPVRFRLVKVPGQNYYQTLRDKLRWATPPGYRNEP